MAKICMVVQKNYYGDPRVQRYVESLAAAGAQIDILCVQTDRATPRASTPAIRVITIPIGHGYKNRLGYFFEYALAVMLFGFYLLFLHLRNRYDVIHVHNMPDFLIFVALIPKWLGAKLILDIHDPMPEFYMSKYGAPRETLGVRLLRLQERWSARLAHEVITANPYFRDSLIGRGIPAHKVTVVNNVPDEKIFNRDGQHRALQNRREHFTLIYPGTIAPRYHLDIAIRALPRILPRIPNLRLRIIGPLVDYVEDLRQLAQQLEVHGVVEFHPAIRIDEVPQQLLQADIGIYLAMPDAHMNIATPGKVLEFAVMGLPIIASRLKVLETSFPESAVLFVDPGDVEAFAQAVVALHDSPEKREDMVRQADAAFVNTHSWQSEMQKYFALLHRLKQLSMKPAQIVSTATGASAHQKGRFAVSMSTPPVVIIGAGPYGLAAAAHLRAANVEVQVFGRPMEFWQHQMPIGMFLRSSWEASHISDPHHALTLDAYQTAHSVQLSTPVPLDRFIAYGQWFQRQMVPDLDRRRVRRIEPIAKGFRLLLEDGDAMEAQRVIVATGIAPFAFRPPQFVSLPPQLASHSSEHNDLGRFAGQHVLVVGGGQSAIESAALLHEAGAEVEVVLRAPEVRWLRRSAWLHHRLHPIRRLLYPATDVGPPVLNQVVARPDLFRQLPLTLQKRVAYRSIRPAAAGWLWPRVQEIRVTTGRKVVGATPEEGRLCLSLDDGTKRWVDHALLATGYRVEISQYSFLPAELQKSLRCMNGYPQLSTGFESSVPGLHFLGAPAAWSFGPLMRFVSGTGYTVRALTRYVLGQNSPPVNGNGRHG